MIRVHFSKRAGSVLEPAMHNHTGLCKCVSIHAPGWGATRLTQAAAVFHNDKRSFIAIARFQSRQIILCSH